MNLSSVLFHQIAAATRVQWMLKLLELMEHGVCRYVPEKNVNFYAKIN